MLDIKLFVIFVDEPVSIEQSDDCVNSFLNFGMTVEKFSGVYKHNVDEVWQTEGLFFYHKQSDNKKVKGVKGCFLSHFLLWKKCLELNQPILILEHDAVAIRSIPENILENEFDVLNLDYASRQVQDYWQHVDKDHGPAICSWQPAEKKGYGGYNKSSIPGIHGYIIKPNGAKKLIDFSKQQGTLPADIQINSLVVDLRYTKNSYVKINPKYWELPNGITRAKPGSPESLTVKDW